jgi:hypothetical protein
MKPYAPYIGLTDFRTRNEVLGMIDRFVSLPHIYEYPHKLMVGVMMSYKTFHGLFSRWTDIFPKKEEIFDIFINEPLLFNMLHYADYTNTDVADSLVQAIAYGGPHLEAIQLDMNWPSPREVSVALSESKRDISVILQVSGTALQEVGNCRVRLAKKLEVYTGVIDGIVLDKSMWHGRPMDADALLLYIDAITRQIPQFRIGVAGGLGPETMDLVAPILARYPKVSIDARSQLRPSHDPYDEVDWSLVDRYVSAADQYLQRFQRNAVAA